MSQTTNTAQEATELLRTERDRLTTIMRGTKSLQRISHHLGKVEKAANSAGEIIIGHEIGVIRDEIDTIAGKLFDARKRKTHAELDKIMKQETGRR